MYIVSYIYKMIISDPRHRAHKPHKSKMGVNICNHENRVPVGYHHNDVVATHALWHMMYGCSSA